MISLLSKWTKSITFRLALAIDCGLVVLIAFLVVFFSAHLKNELLNRVILDTQYLVDAVKRSIEHDMLNRNTEGVIQSIDAISKQKGIEKIRIFNKEGLIVCSSEKSEIGNKVNKNDEACFKCHAVSQPFKKLNQDERFRIFNAKERYRVLATIDPIYNEEACWSALCHAHPKEQNVLGVLDIAVPLRDMDLHISHLIRISILIAAFSIFVICLFIVFVAHKFIRKPLEQIIEGANILAKGNLDYKISVSGPSEICELAHAINKMGEDLKSYIKILTETQESLFHSQRLASLGKLAAAVAHEINNPLTVVLNDSSLLLKEAPEGSLLKEDLKIIVQEAKRCGEIVRDLLEFAKFKKPKMISGDLNQVVEDSLTIIKHQANLGNTDIQLSLAPSLPRVKIDPNQIKQVFIDIILNAIHAMPNDGSLKIKSYINENNFVCVSFTDTGCGISKEFSERIFQPFFTTKEIEGGTGLGLAICYEIIQKHNGRIWFESEVGKGTTFYVELPG